MPRKSNPLNNSINGTNEMEQLHSEEEDMSNDEGEVSDVDDSRSEKGSSASESVDKEDTLLDSNNWTPIGSGKSITNIRLPFTSTGGPNVPININTSSLEIFELFFNENVISMIVAESNRYATQDTMQKKKFSRAKTWIPVSTEEMWIFWGIMILQSVVQK